MRILLLTQIVPYPPDSGPKIKTFNVLRYLAARHEVHLVSFVRPGPEEEHLQSLRSYCASVTGIPLRRSRLRDAVYLLKSLVSGRPFLIERDDLPTMRRAVAALLAQYQFDAVHADQLTTGQFVVNARVPVRLLDEHNAVWSIVKRSAGRARFGPRRLLAELEWRKLRAHERRLCEEFDWVTVVSEEDRLALSRAREPTFRSSVIPITIDGDAMPFVARVAESRDVLSVATMFYPPNVEGVCWFAAKVFPLVRAAAPGTRFRIVGSRPPAHVARLATPDSGIEVCGYVPDLDPLIRRSGVLVVPVHSGSGMRVKILEAFARGIPVVSTTVGVEGIAARDGEHLLIADTPVAFAQAILRLLGDFELSRRLSRAGRRLVEERYDWHTALSGLDAIYASAAAEEISRSGATPL